VDSQAKPEQMETGILLHSDEVRGGGLMSHQRTNQINEFSSRERVVLIDN